MVTYRLYTEDCSTYRANIHAILAQLGFASYTLLHGTGMDNGAREGALIIEIVSPEVCPRVYVAANKIRIENQQRCVLVTETPCSIQFVTGSNHDIQPITGGMLDAMRD